MVPSHPIPKRTAGLAVGFPFKLQVRLFARDLWTAQLLTGVQIQSKPPRGIEGMSWNEFTDALPDSQTPTWVASLFCGFLGGSLQRNIFSQPFHGT